jgi:plasmid stabilization system protein ParE
MRYRVVITDRATRELNDAADWMADRAPRAAERWFNGFCRAILSLREHPRRHGLAREAAIFPYELRQLLYGKKRNHRAVFTIRGDTVLVLTIRHAAQQDLSLEDV